jgi:gas vesicle protein
MSKSNLKLYHKKESNFASGLVWGALLGAAGVFLFATRKGKKARNFFKKHGRTILEELEEVYEEIEAQETLKKKLPKPKKKTKPKQIAETTKQSKKKNKQKAKSQSSKSRKFFTRSGRSLKK